MDHINYKLLYDGDIFSTNLKQLIATNRNLPSDWCSRPFTTIPSFDFSGLESTSNVFLQHLKSAENGANQKFQIIVDSDLDGICSAAIFKKFADIYYPNIETVFSIHSSKQHGLSKDIVIDDDTTLVIIPDAGSNNIKECKRLFDKGIDIICLDHHVIEAPNPYASIVSCMDGTYPNQNLCGAAVTWLFLWGFCYNCISFFDEHQSFLLSLLDLVATATISDIMDVTNEDNMYFIQNGLQNINSNALKAFLTANEINLNDVTVEDIKYKVSPMVSAMIRMGDMPEKILLFRAFIDDYEEFDYEKRGSLGVETENIYDRVVRLCKNAKGRQDRAKQKLLEECKIHEYPHILLVEYQSDKSSPLTGLVANELANLYCKPCIVYRSEYPFPTSVENREVWFSGSVRNYDGSPIDDLKSLLSDAFGCDGDFAGHANACGSYFVAADANVYGVLIEDYINKNTTISNDNQSCVIGERQYQLDFSIPAEELNAGLIFKLREFEHYSGFGFAPVTALVTGIKVAQDNFKVFGKNMFHWKIIDDTSGVDYIKFKINKDEDELVQKLDGFDMTNYVDEYYTVDAICTFGLNVYKGEIYPQCIVKDYVATKCEKDFDFDDDDELDFDLG